MKPNVQCLGHKVLVLQDKITEKTSAGGIIIAEQIQEATVQLVSGVVIDKSDKVLDLEVGDKVLYPKGAGVAHELQGVNYVFLNQHDSPQMPTDIWAKI